MNQLDNETSKSITNFTSEALITAIGILQMVNNGQTVKYRSDEMEKEPPEIVNDIKDKQDAVINELLKNNIKYEVIPSDTIKINDETGKTCKFACVIYNSADHFVRMVENYIVSGRPYKLYLHPTFIEKQEDCYKLYYYLWVKNKE